MKVSLVNCESAREMLIFEQQTKQAYVVQAECFSFKMDDGDNIVSHIAKFGGLILRMQQLSVKPEESSLMVKLLDNVAGGI